ncbi:MAG: long-chain fatty acid--CoA ligase [Chroococcales cyanobacterium]
MPKLAATAYKMSDRERKHLQKLADYRSISAVPEIWPLAAQRFGEIVAFHDPHSKPEMKLTYRQLNDCIQRFAAGLQSLGLKPEAMVALFSDNSPRWMIADQGIMTAGAANAVRSSQADKEELLYIYEHSESNALVVENLKTLNKLQPELEKQTVEFVVLLSDEEPEKNGPFKVINYSELLSAGKDHSLERIQQNPETLATLLYTSGTTGKPKGVMLSHGNLLHQVTMLGTVVQPQPGDRILSILPTWHAYERSGEYFLLGQGCTQIYTSRRYFKQDLTQYKPSYIISVPRIWEAVYDGIQKQLNEQPANKKRLAKFFLQSSEQYLKAKHLSKGMELDNLHPNLKTVLMAKAKAVALRPVHALGEKLIYSKIRDKATGGNIKSAISGGGALAKHIDQFFEILGIELLVGYGLTETAPVTNARRSWHNLIGSAGKPIPGTEIRIVDPETRQTLFKEQKGLVLIRGPQVMQGYYKNPEATEKAIDSQGWFDSGDLGMIVGEDDLVLTGRAKDTIVLTNGENIEPQPIENACNRSEYIDQIMVVGQDQRSLGALIVPNFDALQSWGQQNNVEIPDPDTAESGKDSDFLDKLNSKAIQALFRQELNREVKNRPGRTPNDRIGPFTLIPEPFSIENGMMTQTMKVKRLVVTERYSDIIDAMYSQQ